MTSNSDDKTVASSPETLSRLLEPLWAPNDMINMLNEETQRIVDRGKECKQLLASVTAITDKLNDLKKLHLMASSRTNQLHSECTNIIRERNDLKLSFDRISDMLSKQVEIKNVSKQTPEIKRQILNVLNTVHQSYQQDAPFDDYYDKFFVECRRVKDSIGKLESCLTTTNNEELLLHLEEIYTVYFDIREQLIKTIFTKNLTSLVSRADRNYCDLVRQASLSLVRILRKELQLFNQLFPSKSVDDNESNKSDTPKPSKQIDHSKEVSSNSSLSNQPLLTRSQRIPFKMQALDRFLGLLCKIFYENLRPVVIHVNHLETLTELYKLITEIMIPEVNEECYKLTMRQLAEDVQERMIFRTEVFIEESLIDYKPSGGDLAYPEKLEAILKGGELKDFQSMWYPTVQRTVLSLFYLNRVFDPLTFKELARETVLACYKSLNVAQKLIDERHGGTKIEAAFFLSKHLDIIGDQLESYGIERIDYDQI